MINISSQERRRRVLSVLASVAAALLVLGLAVTGFAREGRVSFSGDVGVERRVAPAAVLEVDLSAPKKVFTGGPVTYTIRVTNTSGSPLDGIVLSDTWTSKLPQTNLWDRADLLAHYQGNYQVTPPDAVKSFTHTVNTVLHKGEAYWELNPLAGGGTVELVFTMTVPISLQPALNGYLPWGQVGPSDVENSVVAGVPGQGKVEAPVVTSLVVAPLLKLEKHAVGEVAPPNSVRVGRLVTYTIRVENVTAEGARERPDTWPAANLVITDRIPEQIRGPVPLINAFASAPVITSYQPITGNLIWKFPTDFVLEPGQAVTLTFIARVPAYTVYNPPTKWLANKKDALLVIADFMKKPGNPYADYNVGILSPFDKVVQTTSPPDQEGQTFPNRIVTYTLTFYNPLQSDISDLLIQDTLYDTFLFARVVDGLQPTSFDANLVTWDNLPTLPANGAISVTFEVTVSAQTPLKENCNNMRYSNGVSATSKSFYEGQYIGHNNNMLASVEVVPQLRLTKRAQPTQQYAGEEVTYTFKIENVGDRYIPGPIWLTDTMPISFTFSRMSSPTPTQPSSPVKIIANVVVWNDVPGLDVGESLEFSFRAIVDGVPNARYDNRSSGYSLETSICPLRTAAVTVMPPFFLNKTASVDTVVQGDTFSYQAELLNASPRDAYTLTGFIDYLPLGFKDAGDGDEVYTETVDPPVLLNPDDTWSTKEFPVLVEGRGTGDPWCDARNNIDRRIPQATGKVWFCLPASGGCWGNLPLLAPVAVIPHISLLQEAYPNPVAVGETMVLTLTLQDNRTNPISPTTGISLQLMIPQSTEGNFVLVGSTPSTTRRAPPMYYWGNLTVPAGGKTQIVLTLKAPWVANLGQAKDYYAEAKVNMLDNPDICIPRSRYQLMVRRGIEIQKFPTPGEVGPYGILEYFLKVMNLTGAPVSGVVITDVLPPGWRYVSLVNGPKPDSTRPLVWALDTISAGRRVEVRFKVRAYTQVGGWLNGVEGKAPINLGYSSNYTKNAMVQVVSGIGFFKVANPKEIDAGQTTVYTITLYNGANYELTNIVITDTLPDGFTFVEMVQGPGDPTVDGQHLVWSYVGRLRGSTSLQYVFRARADENIFSGIYYNQVEARATKINYEPVLIPATGDTAPVTVRGLPVIEVTKSASPTGIRAGREVTYTLRLYNDNEDGYTLRVTDTLPYSFTFVTSIFPPGQPTIVPGPRQRVVWPGLSIAPYESLTLTFRARSELAAPPGSYCNGVQVKMGTFVLPARSGLACVNILEVPRVDAQVSVNDGVQWIAEGQTLTYTIRYTNVASSVSLQSVVLTETVFPFYITLLNASEWNDLGGGRYRRVIGTLGPGNFGQTTFIARLNSPLPTGTVSISNKVEVGYTTSEGAIEVDPTNNKDEDVDFLGELPGGPDLIVVPGSGWFEPANPVFGEDLSVHVTVKNQGQSAASERWDKVCIGINWLFVAELYLRRDPASPPVDVFDHAGGYCVDATCSVTRTEYLAWFSTPGLGVEESQEKVFTVKSPPPGRYTIYIQADVTEHGWCGSKPFGLIREAVESNNIFVGSQMTVASHLDKTVYLPLVLRNR